MQNKDAKAKLIRWIFLLQEFDLKIKDKKGVKNRWLITFQRFVIHNAPVEMVPINENFPDEHILVMCKEPWYADITNYLAIGLTPSIGQNRTNSFSRKYNSSFGMNYIYSNITLTRSLEVSS